MLTELLATAGVVEESVLRSRFGFMAFHGGNLERNTDVIAKAAAEQSGASYYAIVQPPDLTWHLPSIEFDPIHSPTMAAFLDHIDVVVTVHGFGRDGMWATLLLGGQHRELAAHLGAELRTALPAYDICDDMDRIPTALRGVHNDNPVNRPRHKGVQLELPPRVRGITPMFADHDGLSPHTQHLIGALAQAACTWPQSSNS
jgi:phage replication-related protein YjqB (UPF0714/DUF867 family)